MLVVVVDTSTPSVTAALVRVLPGEGVELLAQRCTVDARAHGELLAPAVKAVLDEAGVTPADLTAIVAGVGPGPFTGLRVGLVTAAAMGQALSIPTYGVCSLDGIGSLTHGRTLVATDARRKEIYWAVYEDGQQITEPAVARPADVAPEVDRAAGAGARLYVHELALAVQEDLLYPDPTALARLAADRVRARAAGETLVPLYLRRPDAVEPGVPKPVRT